MTPFGYPSDLYHCLLDEQPYYLVPSRLHRPPRDVPLVLNPQCWFSWRDAPPPGFATPDLADDNFADRDGIVWAPDPATGAVWPYWAGGEYRSFLSRLRPDRPVPRDLPDHIRWVLSMAGILTPRGYPEEARREWLHYLPYRAADFRKGFVVVPHLVPPLHLGALRRYYRQRTRTGCFKLGDNQVGRRYAAHNEPVARYIHEQLAHVVGALAGKPVKPSYAYFVAYQGGSVLEPHTDRPQCEYSITLLVDATPEPEEQSPWPIKLQMPDKLLGVWQYLGESLVYRGRKIQHSRDRLAADASSSSLLLHYVDAGFRGELN
jgi:hypothetical protein